MKATTKTNKKKRLLTGVCILVCIPVAVIPLLTVIIYECVFINRFETASWWEYQVSEFEGLEMERSDFLSEDGVLLAGYKYSKGQEEPKGVAVVCHGLGGGGHNTYMPIIDVFTSRGYYVFSYDVRGNDNSQGRCVEGIPQGVVDLDAAICHLDTVEEYEGLPVVLFGHSWGAYSAGSVLCMHPEIKAVVMVAGFNESEDLIYHRGEKIAGPFTKLTIPFVSLYERIKFGKESSDASVIKGMESSDAEFMIIHSADDTVVPAQYGYSKFYERFGGDDRFEFIMYEDRGHGYPFYSEAAGDYRDGLDREYDDYVKQNGGEYSDELKAEFMESRLDKKKCFEPDAQLMDKIIEMYDRVCG